MSILVFGTDLRKVDTVCYINSRHGLYSYTIENKYFNKSLFSNDPGLPTQFSAPGSSVTTQPGRVYATHRIESSGP